MSIKIEITTIPHHDQRYATVGDWWYHPDATKAIRVSEMGDWRMETLVAVHELVEQAVCQHNAISQLEVDNYDIDYETKRPVGNTSEPGDQHDAPYRDAHCIATGIERILCAALGVSWAEYEEKVNSL